MNTTIFETEEDVEVGSFNHAVVQANLIRILGNLGRFTVCTELSIDVSGIDLSPFQLDFKNEVVPDVCLYPKRGLSKPQDVLKMSEKPILAIEVISPTQGIYKIKEKFRLYFSMGVQSCWLVYPEEEAITVYSSIMNRKMFTKQNEMVHDEIIEIKIPINEIFE